MTGRGPVGIDVHQRSVGLILLVTHGDAGVGLRVGRRVGYRRGVLLAVALRTAPSGFPQVCENEETLGLQVLAGVRFRRLFLCSLILGRRAARRAPRPAAR